MLPPVTPSTPLAASGAAGLKDSNQDAASPVQKPRLEPLVVNHMRFSYAYKKNDAAKIMPFLHKDVTLQTLDGTRLQGLSAVLGHLVGPRMAKLSSHTHIKGSPTRSGLAQSKFVYEHGILFRQPLYIETIDWTPDHAIAAITHVMIPDGRSHKAHVQPELPSPLSSSRGSVVSSTTDNNNPADDDEPEHLDDDVMDTTLRKSRSLGEALARSQSLSRASSSDESTRFSTSSSDGADMVLKIQQITCANLEPFRSRKNVNPFVTIRKSPNGGSQWKSSVARHERNPKWATVPIELHAQHHRENDVLEISVWDFHLFKTVKVATAALVVADLFVQEEDEFATTVQLERMELTDTAPPIQLTISFAQKNPSRHSMMARDRNSQLADLDGSGSTDAASHASAARRTSCCRELMEVKNGAMSGLRWYLQDAVLVGRGGSSMLVRGAFVLLLVWLISQIDFDKHAATRG